MIPEKVGAWLMQNGYGEVVSSRPVGGGCINNGERLHTSSGRSFFLKSNLHAPADMFAREAEGLDALRAPGGKPRKDGMRLPQPYVWNADYLLLEDLAPSLPKRGYWTDFGRRLADLHNHTNQRFGFPHTNYLGSTPQPNPWTEDGWAFFGEHRLIVQARMAQHHGRLSHGQVQQVERLAKRLPELVPAQPASLIHGDLWSGNALADEKGEPAIIDPAAHFGWAEAELAMTALFGGFPDEFYRAYQEVRPLEPGLFERFALYNLYHLLNHLNLFGESYLGDVMGILKKYR
jgi:protein-ribulosamine 3-kinase